MVTFAGKPYRSNQVYERTHRAARQTGWVDWERYLANPFVVDGGDASTEDLDLSDPSSPSSFPVSKHCLKKSRLYYNLLHFKYHAWCRVHDEMFGDACRASPEENDR